VSARTKLFGCAIALALGVVCAFGIFAARRHSAGHSALSGPIWTEASWPFAVDQWGTGKAFQCARNKCGAEITLYLRAKLGSCNCETGIATDGELDRMSDFDLVGNAVTPLDDGQPIKVGRMTGRSRGYALKPPWRTGQTALSVAFNDRCDMVVATALLSAGPRAASEQAVMEFLNSRAVLNWAEVAIGI
jgi:hypothetical protein